RYSRPFPTRRSSDLDLEPAIPVEIGHHRAARAPRGRLAPDALFQVNAADWWLDAQHVGPVAERAVAVVHHQLVGPVVVGIAHPRDRKSTRLNSSHQI